MRVLRGGGEDGLGRGETVNLVADGVELCGPLRVCEAFGSDVAALFEQVEHGRCDGAGFGFLVEDHSIHRDRGGYGLPLLWWAAAGVLAAGQECDGYSNGEGEPGGIAVQTRCHRHSSTFPQFGGRVKARRCNAPAARYHRIMTLLVASVVAPSTQEAAAQVAAAVGARADAIELRVDHLRDAEDVVIRSVAESRPPSVPLILTIRAADEGGAWDGDDVERMSRLIALAPSANFVDVELATWKRSANIRQKVGLAVGAADAADRRRLILSIHDLQGRPNRLHGMLAEIFEEESADLAKIAWRARTVRDNFEAFDLLRTAPKPLIALCLGPNGHPSRILARKFGAFASYAAVDEAHPAAPGQLSMAELRGRFRWDAIGPTTRVFGLVGQPVEHSLSPDLHNTAFGETGFDAVYLTFPVEPSYESFKAFMLEALARPWLDLGGLSITIPHKENALRFVREHSGKVDSAAERAGAVNTLRVSDDQRVEGFNTDVPAVLEAITGLLGRKATELGGLRCAVLGAGGVARAVVAALAPTGTEITVYNRTTARAERLAGEMGCAARTWSERALLDCELVVNCTSIGMGIGNVESPLAAEALRPGMFVFDTIYRPAETKLVALAVARGCRAANGVSMFVDQAVRQFSIWTAHPAPRARMLEIAERHLQTDNSA